MVNFGVQKHDVVQRGLIRKATTHLAKIAVVLQDAPDKMMTFSQLMSKLAPVIPEDRKSVESNIRVCLSSNKCFLKIPMIPGSHDSKKNYWKLDTHHITEKMVRRHFKGILDIFPELASKVKMENISRPSKQSSALCSPEPAACRGVQCVVKFNSPFSIESLLKRDSPSAQTPRSSPLYSMSEFKEEEEEEEEQPGPSHGGATKSFSYWGSTELLVLEASSGLSPICSRGGITYHGVNATGADEVGCSWMHVPPQPSIPVYARPSTATYFTGLHGGYITYSAPNAAYDVHQFWL